MNASYWRKTLNNVVLSSLPVMAAMLPSSQRQEHPVMLNGCYTDFRNTYRSKVHIELPATMTKVLSYEECIRLCKAAIGERQCFSSSGTSLKLQHCKESKGEPSKKDTLQCSYTETYACIAGRLPAGLHEQEAIEAASELGAYFAQLAYLEEAAVHAFAALALELEAYDAPESLVMGAKAAVYEEQEHASMMQMLAEIYGASVPKVSLEPFAVRSLWEVALDNATEGCVRETLASMLGQWQAQASTLPEVRAVMGRVSHDEMGHAALSWAIDAWSDTRLSVSERQQKQAMIQESWAALLREEHPEPSLAMTEIAGVPHPGQLEVLLNEARRQLWEPLMT